MLNNFKKKLKEIYETEWEINIELSLEQLILVIVFIFTLLWLILF